MNTRWILGAQADVEKKLLPQKIGKGRSGRGQQQRKEAEAGVRHGTLPDTNKSDREGEYWPGQRGQVAPGRTPEEPHTEPVSEGVPPKLRNME